MSIKIERILMIIAAYGVIQILAQDLGIKTGKKQRDMVQKLPNQIIFIYAGAYAVTTNHLDSLITTSAYYFLKYIYSDGKTSPVCFEDV